MSPQRIVLLDGSRTDDHELSPILEMLIRELHKSGASVQTFRLRDMKMGCCVGCFGCWLKTPGVCLEPDAGREIAQAIITSDVTIIFSPITFGGYSSHIKKSQDRWLPLVLPDFGVYHNEVHHRPRYSRYPRFVGIGVQHQRNERESSLFKLLVGRNALNFHAPSYAAEVITSSDPLDQIQRQIQDALARHDPLPLSQQVKALMQTVVMSDPITATSEVPGRALLIVGSPKVTSPSTSASVGNYLLEQLKQQGWSIESMTLRGNLLQGHNQSEFCAAADRADLLLLAFPLYIDSLPFLVMKALEILAAHFANTPPAYPKRLVAIANNGFPEAHHNAIALSICQHFAAETGLIWAGGLALGAGEALFSGLPVEEAKRSGRLPVAHVKQALDQVSAALTKGQMVPPTAVQLMAKCPIPLPFRMWRWLFMKTANRYWRQRATINQVGEGDLLAQPYADASSTT